MSNHTLEERISSIEVTQRFHEQSLVEQRSDIKEIKETLGQIKTALEVFNARCVSCQSQPLEPRVRKLEDKSNLVLGGWKGMVISGSLFILIVKAAWEYLKGNNH